MGLWKKKDPYAGGRRLLDKMNGKHIAYASRRDPETYQEHVLGKEGGIVVTEDRVIVLCEGIKVFEADLYGVRCGELLSGDGVTLEGVDAATGQELFVTAYFSRHTKY